MIWLRFRNTWHTGQFAVIQFESVERVGAVEQHMALGVDRLQLLHRGFATSDSLYEQDNVQHTVKNTVKNRESSIVLSSP